MHSNIRLTTACPPLAHQPSGIAGDRTPYHSLRLAFPNITAPSLLNRSTTPASLATVDPSSAYDPQVVFSLSLVPILSFNSMGIPCNSPNDRHFWSFSAASSRSRSASSAWFQASGFTSSILRSWGFNAAIWSKYKSTSCLEVSWFSLKARWMSSMVASVIVNCEPLIALTKIQKNKVHIFVSIMFQQNPAE